MIKIIINDVDVDDHELYLGWEMLLEAAIAKVTTREDDDIGAVECGWVIKCHFLYDTDDEDVDENDEDGNIDDNDGNGDDHDGDGDDAMFGSADIMLDSYRDFFW